MSSLDIHLDQARIKIKRCSEVMGLAKAEIRRRLRGKRGRKCRLEVTKMSRKDKKSIESSDSDKQCSKEAR